MGWEKRGHHLYYYRKRREGKRVISEYVGRGELAEATATLDALDRHEQEDERAALRDEREAQRAVDQAIDTAGELVRALTHTVLLASGYHKHKGQWRKRRDGQRAASGRQAGGYGPSQRPNEH